MIGRESWNNRIIREILGNDSITGDRLTLDVIRPITSDCSLLLANHKFARKVYTHALKRLLAPYRASV